MKKISKRIISLMLCVAMIFSMGIVNAFAAEEGETQTGSYNLLVNPDFELGSGTLNDTSNTIESWTKNANGGKWMDNNPYSGTYGFALEKGTSNHIYQTVKVPETTEYKLTGYICGKGTFGIYKEDGEAIQTVAFSDNTYTQLVMDNIALSEGDIVTIKCTAGSSWVNGDELVFATKANYDLAALEKTIGKIDAIGKADEARKLAAILVARSGYDALPESVKDQVTNYSDLVQAEENMKKQSSPYNLLVNPDFEYGLATSATINTGSSIVTAWTKSGGQWKNNNAHSGSYGFYLGKKTTYYIYQIVEVPETANYKLTGYLSGTGTFGIYDEDGSVIKSVQCNEGSYTLMTLDGIALTEGQRVTIKCYGGSSGLNGDEFVFATEDTYDLVAVDKTMVKIDAIAEASENERLGAILMARSAYDALSDAAKEKVTNYEILKQAEEEVDEGTSSYNLLVNPDFELGYGKINSTSNTVYGWTKSAGAKWMNTNPRNGEYAFALNSNGENYYIYQTVEVPETTTYKLTAYLSGTGTLSISYENGEVIQSVVRDVRSYAFKSMENIQLNAGDRVTIMCTGGTRWLNGDDFIFATTDTYDLVMLDKAIYKIDSIAKASAEDKKAAVDAARTAYDALSSDLKAQVDNYQTLVQAEKEVAYGVRDQIAALGEITKDSLAAVMAAREAYDDLSAVQKELITNLHVLEDAEKVLTDLGVYIQERQTPLMGWSSWNCFDVQISEELLRKQVDAMVDTGLAEAGYIYFNIDDGYQYGRSEETGLVMSNPNFPSGMRAFTDYVHSKGLKAGIYTDAGDNTCASLNHGQGADGTGWGLGVGLVNNWEKDLNQYFIDWNFDFIKVDWCGGSNMGLNKEEEYTRIGKIIDKIEQEKGSDIVYNVCCWAFPGAWVTEVADSWRISMDIKCNFQSVLNQIDAAKILAEFNGPGHVNDLDMLEVGNGMTYDEDKSHFSMWCMMSAPLLLGNDLTNMDEQTLEILTNKELIAIDQDPACIMATVAKEENNVQIWQKPLGSENSNVKAVAIFNRNNYATTATLNWEDVGFTDNVQVRDLWEGEDVKVGESYAVTLPAHGIVVLKVTGESNYSESVIDSTLTSTPESVDLAAQGTLDWVDLAKGTQKDSAFVVGDDANEKSLSLKAVTTDRVAYIYFTADGSATLTATLDGKQASDVFSGNGVYTIRYAGTLGGTDLTVSIEGGTIQAVAVANGDSTVSADAQMIVSNAARNGVIDLTEGTAGYVSFAGQNGTIAKGNLSDFVTAEGAVVTGTGTGAAQGGVYNYFELYLPATDTLTKANIYYGLVDGSATILVQNGFETDEIDLYDINHGKDGVLTVWYTAAEDVTVLFRLDSAFATDSAIRIDAVTLSKETNAVLTNPVVSENNGTLDIVAQTGGSAADVKFVAEVYDAEGNLAASSANDVTLGGQVVNSVALPEVYTNGSLKVYLSSGESVISNVYTVALPLTDESVPTELEKIGNLLAKELVANGAILLDVRSAEEYEAGHIEGAINILYTDILTSAEKQLTDKSKPIIVYCSAGKRSAQAQMALLGLGYENVYNIGAMDNWYIEPSITISGADASSLEQNAEVGVVYEANPYEKDLVLYYSLGKNSSFENAVQVPEDNVILLNGDGWVKAYLTYNNKIVATAEEKLPLLVNLEIPEWDVDVFMSDLTWDTNESYWKAAKKDLSIDGNALSIAGNSFEKGIGAHAWSIIECAIPEGMTRFVAVAGADDETGKTGYKTQYAVFVDDVLMEESAELPIGYYHVFDVNFPVNAKTIRLEIYNTDDGTNYDHADWGIAGFVGPDESDYNAITVVGGTVSAEKAAWGETVTLTADEAPEGKIFNKWVVEPADVQIADASAANTTFVMPNAAVTITATYAVDISAVHDAAKAAEDAQAAADAAQKAADAAAAESTADKTAAVAAQAAADLAKAKAEAAQTAASAAEKAAKENNIDAAIEAAKSAVSAAEGATAASAAAEAALKAQQAQTAAEAAEAEANKAQKAADEAAASSAKDKSAAEAAQDAAQLAQQAAEAAKAQAEEAKAAAEDAAEAAKESDAESAQEAAAVATSAAESAAYASSAAASARAAAEAAQKAQAAQAAAEETAANAAADKEAIDQAREEIEKESAEIALNLSKYAALNDLDEAAQELMADASAEKVKSLIAASKTAREAILDAQTEEDIEEALAAGKAELEAVSAALCAGEEFTDVDVNAWYHDAIDFVINAGMMSGNGDGTFTPETELSRAMLVQILYNIEGKPEVETEKAFSDVAEDDWYYDAVMWAAEKGIVLGNEDGTYAPEDSVSREQMVTILYRYAGSPEVEDKEITFTDAADIDVYAQDAVAWAVANGVVKGVGDNKFSPDGNSTRAETAQVMLNYFKK